MSWSYNTSLATNKDKVRIKIMDVDTTSQEFSDEEINAILTDVSQNVIQAAVRLAKSLAFRYAKKAVSKRAGPYSEDTTKRAEMYAKLAEDLANEADEPWEEIAEMPMNADPTSPYQSQSEKDFIAREDIRSQA